MKINFRSFVFIFFLLNFAFIPGLGSYGQAASLPDKNVVISMDLQDASLKDVLKLLSIQSGLNFVASEALQDRKITLYMDNVPLKEAMDMIFKANNLTYDLDQEASVFIVNDWGKPATQTLTKVFYLKHATVSSSSLKEEMKNNMSATASTSGTSGTSGMSSSSGSSTSSTGSSSSGSSSSTETGKWKVEEDAGITQAVKKILSKDGSVIEDFRTNSLIVTDIPSKMEVITRVIASLDVSVSVVMLEVEILDVSKNVVDEIGFKFGQTPFSIALKGATISTEYPFPSSMYSFRNVAKTLTGGSVDISNGLNGTSIYRMQLDFLRTQTDTKFLARPKILTLNNETAEIKITTQEAIGVTAIQSGTGTSSTTTTEAERFETGVLLRVTPQVDLDAGEIMMFVYPQVSEASTTSATFTSNNATYTFLNPEVRSTKTSVRVKDGETVVLGGLIRNQTTTVITKLPFLGDIPLLGALFRHKEQSPGRERELLVFITPHIVKNGKMDSPLPANKNTTLPLREQAKIVPLGRQQSMNTYLNSFETKR